MTRIKCAECGYENETERVYCHNCGVKLDRSLFPKEPEKPSPSKTRRRVKSLTKPNSGFFVGFWKKLFSTLLWAAFVAAIVQIVRPPRDIPKMPNTPLVEAAPISLILEDAIQKGSARPIRLSAQNVNNYLFNTVRSKANGVFKDYVKFDRAFVVANEGVLEISVQQSVMEYPFYATTFYELNMKEDGSGLDAKNVGGRFGSLPIHPLIMPFLEYPVQKLWSAMKRERRLMERLADVEVTKGAIVLTPPATPSTQ
jgi:transcription initiation factor TFIIIB Brf1 subunit/transcription initiation factor TFIIB